MKVYEDQLIPAKTARICVRRKCDLCGIESNRSDWDGGTYDVNETEIHVTIRDKQGENYPEGSWGTAYEIDLCPACFRNRLVPWLREQGAKIEEQEYDY